MSIYDVAEFLLELIDKARTECKTRAQTPLSESYNYRHFRTATNVSAITYTGTKTPARTRKNSPTTHFSPPNRTPPPSPPQCIQKPPPPQLVATKGMVSIYELDQKPSTTQQPPCWAWGLRSRGCGYAPQYVPQPHPRAHRSPACCHGNGTKQRRAPHPHRQQSE